MSARRAYFRLPEDWAQMSDAEKTAWADEVAREIVSTSPGSARTRWTSGTPGLLKGHGRVARMARYLALLRGINVGGRNIIKMADLRACFVDEGFERVTTYIQSGNVVFDARGSSAAELARRIADLLAANFDYDASLVLLEARQMRRVVDGAPPGFGTDPDRFRSDVIFLMPGLHAADVLRDVPTREGVDRAWAGEGVLYFERLTERASQSRLTRITTQPIYQRLTIRNWNTTRKLLELAAGD